MRNKKRTTHLLQVATLVLIASLGLLLMDSIRNMIDRRVESMKRNLITQMEERFGMELSYDSISPNLLSAVTILNLDVSFPKGNFIARRARVFFNPLRFFGSNGFDQTNWITRISIITGHLRLTSQEGNKSPFVNSSIDDFITLLEAKTIVLKDFSATIETDRMGTVSAEDMMLQMERDGQLMRYEFSGDVLGTLPIPQFQRGEVNVKLQSSGSYSPLASSFIGRIEFHDFKLGVFEVPPISVALNYKDGKITMRRISDVYPIDLVMSLLNDDMAVSGKFARVPINKLLRPYDNYPSRDSLFDAELDGEFSINMDVQTNSLSYDINLSLASSKSAGISRNWRVDIDMRGNEEVASISDLSLAIPQLSAGYKGRIGLESLTMAGLLNVKADDKFLGNPMDANFIVSTNEGMISVKPIEIGNEGSESSGLSLLFFQEGKQYTLSVAFVPFDSQRDIQQQVFFDAVLNVESQPEFHGFTRIEGVEMAQLAKWVSLPLLSRINLVKDSYIGFQGLFKTNLKTWKIEVEEASLVSKRNLHDRIMLHGHIRSDSWSLNGLKIDWGGYSIDAQGSAQYSGGNGLAEGSLVIQETLYPFEAIWTHQGRLRITSTPGIIAVLGPKTRNGRTMSVNLTEFTLPLKDKQLLSELDIAGVVSRKEWRATLNRSRFTLMGSNGEIDSVFEFTGRMNPRMIEFHHVDIQDSHGGLNGNARINVFQDGNPLTGNLQLTSNTGESYRLFATHAADEWDVSLNIDSGRLDRLSGMNIQGLLDIQADLKGSLENPTLLLGVSVNDGHIGAHPFNMNFNADMQEGKLSIYDLDLFYKNLNIDQGMCLVNLDVGTIRTTAKLDATFNKVPVSTGFLLGLDFERGFSLLEISSLLTMEFTGTLATNALLWDGNSHLPALTFQFNKTKDSLRVRNPDNAILTADYSFTDGRLEILSGDPMPFVAKGGGTIHNGQLDLSFPRLEIDPVFINYFMPRDPILLQYHVVFQEGRLVGNLDIEGPASSPELNGTVHAVDIKVDTPYTQAGIEPVGTSIHFAGNRIDFDRVEVPVGSGIAFGEGYMVLEGWKIADMDMAYGCMPVNKSDGVPVSYPLIGIYIDGSVTADLRMTGNYNGFHLDGDINFPYFKASLGSPRIPVRQRRPGKRPKQVTLDFRIYTGNNGTFYLPNEQLKIMRVIAEPGNMLTLKYSNVPKTMTLVGTLPIKSGDIYYFDRNFQITEGSIVFNEALGKFDPFMRLRAETRVLDDNNEQVTVALVYDAPIKSDFNPVIETIPTRSEPEILALLGHAIRPYGETNISEFRSVLLATGGMFAHVGLVQPFEEVLREKLNLDMVTIQTNIIENALVDSFNWNTGSAGEYQMSSLGRYLNNTSLYAGKHIGNALFASGSISTRFLEGQRLRSVLGGLEFETSMSLEMTTPFFNIEWSYSPDPTVKQNFVANNVITLKWQFLY